MNGFIGVWRALFIAAAVVGAVLLSGCGDNNGANTGGDGVSFGSFTYDGQTYKTVKIGGQTWMAENLNVETGDSWCYDDNSSNCNTYGRLYTWEAAKSACQSVGWRLPTKTEWEALVDAAGGSYVAGKALKSTTGWHSNSGTDTYGFSALPAGVRYSGGTFFGVGNEGRWWTVTELGSSSAYSCGMGWDSNSVSKGGDGFVVYAYSVRCVAD